MEKQRQDLNGILGKYRTLLMGIAILWILFFHMNFITWNKGLFYFHKIGFFGVDIFFFLSAYGLYYSLSKKSALQFYKARIIRIYPIYMLVAASFFFLNGLSGVTNFILYITGIGYWVGKNYFEWYVPTLLVFYLLTPGLYYLFNKSSLHMKKGIFLISIILSVLLSLFAVKMGWSYIVGSLTRIPIFVLGFYCGYLAYNKNEAKKYNVIKLLLISSVGVVISYISTMFLDNTVYLMGFDCYPALLLAPCICYVAALLFSQFEKYKPKLFKIVTFPLFFCGTISFELYLVHQRLRDRYLSVVGDEVLILVGTIIIALLIHQIEKIIRTKIMK